MTDRPDPQSGPACRTRTVTAARQYDNEPWLSAPPIVTATALVAGDTDAVQRRIAAGEPTYHRDHFANAVQLEQAISELEGAEAAYATASGMAAISAVVFGLLQWGDHVIVGKGGYSDTEELLTRECSRFGIRGSVVDLEDADALRAALMPETRLIFVETIANPSLMVPDLPEIARIAHGHGALLVVDNTVATPVLCRPIEHGADLVVHSATKFLGGHHDLTAGAVAGAESVVEEIARVGYLIGAVPGAHDAALALRGIRTLAPRMAWISESGERIARYLSSRPEIAQVRHPSLAEGLTADRVRRLLPNGGSGVLTFEFAPATGDAPAARFVRMLQMIPYLTSLGGEFTSVCYPPRILGDAASDQAAMGRTLRMSVGLEDPADIIADLGQAFERMETLRAGDDDGPP